MSKIKNKVLGLLGLAGVAVAGIHLAEGIVNHGKVRYERVTLKSSKVGKELNGYKIAFITDTHYYPEKNLQKIVDTLNKEDLDLCLLGGDFARGSKREPSVEIVSKTKTRDGIFGVHGNHDRRYQLFGIMEKYGITPLYNSGVNIRKNLFLGGAGDYQWQTSNIGLSLAEAKPNDFTMLLCHNPDTTMVQDTTKADISLCGHTHGGEVSLFGAWAPLLSLASVPIIPPVVLGSRYGQKFSGGLAKTPFGGNVYVSRGVGSHSPLRIFCPAEVTILTLKSSQNS